MLLFSFLLNLLKLLNATKYIVTTNTNYNALDYNLFNTNEGKHYEDTFNIGELNGYIMNYKQFPNHLYSYSFIENIEEDEIISINLNSNYYLQQNPIWNLDRLDQHSNTLNNKFYYYTTSGINVTVFVIDTGIDINHPEFEGRAIWGTNKVDNNNIDCNGHGTHVSGSIGGKTYGVAKKTKLVAVKVLDCQGSGAYSGILAGFQYVYDYHNQNNKPMNLSSVINMSLGGPKSDIINKGIAQLTSSGIHVVVAAGNENADACNTSPASEESAITVGAITRDNTMAQFSNWGKCVNILAPGTEILSSWPNNKTQILQGTSMSSPQIAGVIALLMSNSQQQISPDIMKKQLTNNCSKGYITCMKTDTPNCLGYSFQ